jgi:hypothetical protein
MKSSQTLKIYRKRSMNFLKHDLSTLLKEPESNGLKKARKIMNISLTFLNIMRKKKVSTLS